jgi:hypothetical protein
VRLKSESHRPRLKLGALFLFRNVSELLHLSLQKIREPYNFIKFTKLEPNCLTLLRKLINVKSVIHGMVEIIVGFVKHGGNPRKKTTKIAQFEHYFEHYSAVKTKVSPKKNMAVHPLSTLTPAPKRSSTVPTPVLL